MTLTTSNTYIGFSTPAATFDPSGSLNGNSAKLYATVNPNGLDTMVYFECGTGASYDISTPQQSIGNGTTAVTVSADITDLLPNTAYQCRVVVTNAYGTVYGNDVGFTTPPITLTIIYPVNVSTINRPDILVRGSLSNAAGNETGVTVNGVVAVVNNGEFFANHVPLSDGPNIIIVNAVDTGGNAASVSITLNADTSAPHITLKADIESGLPPFGTYFSVSTQIPNEVVNYRIDFEGDGIYDYDDLTFDNINTMYQSEGTYYPVLTITDNQNITYTDTIAIVALSISETDTVLNMKWGSMKALMLRQNVGGALNHFSDESRNLYNELFTALYDQLPQIAQGMQGIQVIYVKNNAAKYRIRRSEVYGGQMVVVTYYIYFERDKDGLWKIKRF